MYRVHFPDQSVVVHGLTYMDAIVNAREELESDLIEEVTECDDDERTQCDDETF